jgi:hypothetical protein
MRAPHRARRQNRRRRPHPSPTREFQRLLAAEGISNFGAMLSRLAIPWLAALGLPATRWQMAMLLVADVGAASGGALLLGAWVERRGRREVMLWCDGARALVLLALAALAWRGEAMTVGLAAVALGLDEALALLRRVCGYRSSSQISPTSLLPKLVCFSLATSL